MSKWDKHLERWVAEGFLDAIAAERIASFEAQQAKSVGLRWPVVIAISLGGLLLGAGVLLFVAAHWEGLSPNIRFAVVLSTLAVFHIAGALSGDSFPVFSSTMHAVGTVALGAGIYLAGQIFHLQEHWPGGIMLWAMGAGLGWLIMRDWVHGALLALLVPAWVTSEWLVAVDRAAQGMLILAVAQLLWAITYLTARTDNHEGYLRMALVWIGAIGLFPAVILVIAEADGSYVTGSSDLTMLQLRIGWAGAVALPIMHAWYLRRKAVWLNLLAALWAIALASTGGRLIPWYFWDGLGPYLLCLVGGLGLIGWGLRERRSERINLGCVGFAVTVIVYYFSNVMDKLDRAASLIGLGVLFLAGGWLLERTRRGLVAHIRRAPL